MNRGGATELYHIQFVLSTVCISSFPARYHQAILLISLIGP
jgi:hypothetical protein